MAKKDLTGKMIGDLEVLYENGRTREGRVVWHCKCHGCKEQNEVDVCSHELLNGDTTSCGCKKRKMLEERNYKHGEAGTHFYKAWQAMKRRCDNKSQLHYCYYGGRGITYQESWASFENFKKDMYDSYIEHIKEYGKKDTTLDRIDVDGNYCLDNCRWATKVVQANNTRRNTFLTYNGETHTLSEWSKILDIRYDRIINRLSKGYSVEDILYKGNLKRKG